MLVSVPLREERKGQVGVSPGVQGASLEAVAAEGSSRSRGAGPAGCEQALDRLGRGRTPRGRGSLGQVHQGASARRGGPVGSFTRTRCVVLKIRREENSLSCWTLREASEHVTTPELGSRSVYPSAPASALGP